VAVEKEKGSMMEKAENASQDILSMLGLGGKRHKHYWKRIKEIQSNDRLLYVYECRECTELVTREVKL